MFTDIMERKRTHFECSVYYIISLVANRIYFFEANLKKDCKMIQNFRTAIHSSRAKAER
jgi:hypothetical protein